MIDGVTFVVLEDFSKIPLALKSMPQGGRWDILAIDEFMTAEVVYTGSELYLAMYAEIAGSLPKDLTIPDPDISVEERNDVICLRAWVKYPFQGIVIYKAMIQKINVFRRLLGELIQRAQA